VPCFIIVALLLHYYSSVANVGCVGTRVDPRAVILLVPCSLLLRGIVVALLLQRF